MCCSIDPVIYTEYSVELATGHKGLTMTRKIQIYVHNPQIIQLIKKLAAC